MTEEIENCGQEKCHKTRQGISIYSYGNPDLHSFCICLYIRNGCLFEKDEENGSSHFFEHMVFRNIQKSYHGELYHMLDKLGLNFNACTYKEFIQFTITGASVHFNQAAEIITKILEPMKLTSKEIDPERKRIKQEIREADDIHSLDYFTDQIVWKDTPVRNTIAGNLSNLDHMGVHYLKDLAGQMLSVNNLFFYVTGSFKNDQLHHLISCIDQYFINDTVPKKINVAPVPTSFFHRDVRVEQKNSTYYRVRLSFDVDTSLYTEAECSLLYDVLFTGESSKIHQVLSEDTGYIYSFDSEFERYDNVGNLHLSYEVRPADLYDSILQVIDVFQWMKTKLTDELDYVIPFSTENALLLFDDPEEFNWTYAYECHILSEPYSSIKDRIRTYQSVTPQRIMEMAREIFTPQNLLITLKAPKGKGDHKKIREIGMQLINLK